MNVRFYLSHDIKTNLKFHFFLRCLCIRNTMPETMLYIFHIYTRLGKTHMANKTNQNRLDQKGVKFMYSGLTIHQR